MAMNFRNVRLFLAVAQDMHFSNAARRMNIAQPALSRAIRALESELGTDLFRRSTRKVELTEAGRLFQQDAQKAIDHLDLAMRSARKAAAGDAGTLSIGYMDFAIEGEFPRILREFGSRYPAVSVEAKASFTERIIDDLQDRKIDVGFVVGPVARANLATFNVQNDRFVVVVPETHPLAQRSGVRLRELTDEPLVLGRRESWSPYVTRIEDLCREAGFTPRVVQEADTMESLFAFVASGIGSTLYVERAFNYAPPGIKILPLEDVQATISTEVTWRVDDRCRLVKNFISLCKELIKTTNPRAEIPTLS
jgi:DNA-binding transcriptional LysR family regulator